MTEWSDPRILVAIVTGGVGALSGLGSVLFNVYASFKQRGQARNQAVWEEYRETVYDPMRSVLRHVEDFAKRCRRTQGGIPQVEEDRLSFFRDLSEMMNEAELFCAKADERDASTRRDWSEQAETKARQIHDLINDHDLDRNTSEHAAAGLLDLEKSMRAYVQFFDDRLLEQRKALLDF